MARRLTIGVMSISGFQLPRRERSTGIRDIERMCKKFQGSVTTFRDLELIHALTRDRVIVRHKGEIIVQKSLKSFFNLPGIHHFIVHYTGHGKGKGDWFLPDWSRFTLKHILNIWSESCHSRHEQDLSDQRKLLLISDSCFSGVSVDKLNDYHRRGQYQNVEMITASHGEAKYRDFGDIGSDLTKAICNDEYCPVGTVCTRSLKSSLSDLVEMKRDRSKWCLKFKWKLG